MMELFRRMLDHHTHSCHSIGDPIVLSLFCDYLERQFDHDGVVSANAGTPHSFMPFDWRSNCFIFIRWLLRTSIRPWSSCIGECWNTSFIHAIQLDTQLFFFMIVYSRPRPRRNAQNLLFDQSSCFGRWSGIRHLSPFDRGPVDYFFQDVWMLQFDQSSCFGR